MPFSTYKEERYSPERVERLKAMISRLGKEFAVFIDDLKIVPRTADVDQFDCFEEYVDNDSNFLKIQIFQGASNLSDNFTFYFKSLPKAETTAAVVATLSGVEMDLKITEKLETERMKWDTQLLREKLEKSQADLKEAEDHMEKITAELEEERRKAASKAIWNELGSTMLSIVKSSPAVLSGIPGLGALAGAPPVLPPPSAETEASFSRKDETSEEDEQYLLFLKSLQTSFNAEEFTEVMAILRKLAEEPSLIPSVKGLL